MSWSIHVVGRDKEKLKEAVRAEQCKDEEKSPHNGVPSRVVKYLCDEIDRIRVYTYQDKVYGIKIDGNGSFHEQGSQEHVEVGQTQLVE